MSLFEFLRNNDLDANNFFTNAAGLPKSPFHQNQFGGAVGGPIVHNKTFFFADYQGTRQATSAGSSIRDVPPADLRSGDFSKGGATIYDPNTRQIGPNGVVIATPFPGNVIPQGRLNPTAVAIANQVPLPNFGAPGALARNFFYQPARFSNTDQGDIRIDQTLSAKNNLYGRFSISAEFAAGRRQFPGVHRRRHFVAGQLRAGRALGHPHLYSVAGERVPLRLHPAQRQYFRDRAGRRRVRAAE